MEARNYEPKDSDEVRNLVFSILEKEYPFHRNAYQDTDINDISGTYSGGGNAFFVIDTDGKIAGTVGVKKETAETVLVRRLFVDEAHRRKGYGQALLKKAIDFCKSENYKEAVFRATDRMFQAMSLCKKNGFKETEDLEVSGFHIHKFVLKL